LHTKLRFKALNARDDLKVRGMNEIIILKWIIHEKSWQAVDWIHLLHEGHDLRGRANVVIKYIHIKSPTRCNTSILVLLQDNSTRFGYFPHPSSGVQ
jgi:hypothetical protein